MESRVTDLEEAPDCVVSVFAGMHIISTHVIFNEYLLVTTVNHTLRAVEGPALWPSVLVGDIEDEQEKGKRRS